VKSRFLSLPGACLLASCLILLVQIAFNGWVSDDAYITFRFLDNLFAGNGLRWNIDERVQAYTHPLWMFLHIPLYAVWDNIFLVTIIMSLLCTAGALAFVIATFERPAYITIIYFVLPLMLSKAFIDFSTSGLENPLSHLLFASFGYIIVKQRGNPNFWFYSSLSIALAMLNRLDTVIFYLPPMIWLALRDMRGIRIGQIILGAMPLICWFAFSLFYYGFLFPNTKYAKLNTGIAELEYVKQGVLYFLELFSSDPFSYMMLCITLAHTFDSGKDVVLSRWRKSPSKAKPNAPNHALLLSVGIGTLAYMGYVTLVGGDFMSGRFLAMPFFVTVWLIYAPVTQMEYKRAAIYVAFLIALKGMSLSIAADSMERCVKSMKLAFPADLIPPFCTKSGIADERAFYYPNRAWFHNGKFDSRDIFQDRSYYLAQIALRAPEKIYVFGAIGAIGYYAPNVKFVDYYALTDPLLARLPIRDIHDWRIGHFGRSLPDGYLFALRTGNSDQMDPALRKYYDPLRLIVSGNLLDPKRLQAIWDFNTGYYDHYKEEYLRALAADQD